MTTVIGTQLRPYVAEKTEEKESVPCQVQLMPATGSIHPCPNEAKYTGVCLTGDASIDACENCMTRHSNKDTNFPLMGWSPCGHWTIISQHELHGGWRWFPR
jgi:hypothetical protein